MKKRLLSLALVLVMVLSLLPATAVSALAADDDTVDAFGITLSDWTAAEKAEAEANLPFGAGYNTWTTLSEKNELFFSMGYDGATRLTGLFDWNGTEGTTVEAIRDKIDKFGQSQLTSRTENYKAVATAAMDLYGTGKKEYVANLALNASGNTLYLYVTDSSNRQVGVVQWVFENVAQLGGMQIHQINGAFSIAAGDFDGDGKDTIVVYVPQTDANKNTKNGTSPFIKEFSFDTYNFQEKSTVAANVLTLLGNNQINMIDKMHNQPMVDLVAEDVDKDGFDELIVTAGMNDVTSGDTQLQSQVFIYDRLNGKTAGITPTGDGKWNLSYQAQGKCASDGQRAPGIYIEDKSYKRVVWASSTVGNVIMSVGSDVDYPEIVTAGFIDDERSNTQHINVGGDDDIGVSVVQVKSVTDSTSNKFTYSANGKSMSAVNVICEYGEAFNQSLGSNSWTRGGFYESEDVNGLLQVQAYADRGIGSAEAVFISGTVYRSDSEGEELEEEYTHAGFKSKDDFAPGGRVLTNTTVAAVTAGNFDGNDEGREQLLCVTAMKQSGKNNAYSQVYFYHNEATCGDDDSWSDKYDSKRSGYLTEHKGHFYVSLAPLDTDDDSILVKLEEITRDYSKPDVLAILETSPYFAEIEDSFNNSETTYGLSSTTVSGYSNTFGFKVGSSVGYEFESDLTQSGGGFEVAIERAYNWTTAKSTSEEWGIEFRNDTGDNAVVVYRCPVVTYRYVDQDGKKLLVEQVGQPATNMISVDDYNEAAAQYDDLDLIDDNIVKLGESGNPASYRSSTKGMTNALQYNGPGMGAVDGSNGDSSGGWAQYQGSGSMMQYWTGGKETEKTFSYDLGVSLNIFAKIGGVTASATFGFAYAREQTHINGRSVTKSGAVSCVETPGYNFRWKLAAWNCELNGGTVPVIGYLVKDVVAPPSPAEGLTAESITTDSITLRWSSGLREADQYRIYRIRETAPQYVLVGAVQGDETSFTLTGLKPGETYTYVVRGVSYLNNSESVDSAPITVRTQSEGSTVRLKLVGASLTSDNILQSTGAEASLSAQVSGISGGSASYQWQLLENDAEGIKNGWRTVSALPSTAIGSVSGATSSSLTLRTIDKSLSGAYLRCVVTTTSSAGDIETYYSPIVTLDLNGLTTTTTVAVAGQTGISGSITDPYVGLANYTAISEEKSYSSVQVPASAEKDGKIYTIYQDATAPENNPVYVAVLDESDTGSRTYYAAAANTVGESVSYTPGDRLTPEGDSYYYRSGDTDEVYPVPNDFTGVDTVSEPGDDGTIYVKQYAVTDAGLTAYWRSAKDGLYYTRSVDGETVSFTKADPQPDSGADLRMVYYESDSLLILDAAELTETVNGETVVVSSEYDRYAVYSKAEGEADFALYQTIWRVPGTKLYRGETEYVDSAKLTAVTVEERVAYTTPVSTPRTGEQITLQSAVTDKTGAAVSTQVLFTITNTDTGAVTQITATNGTATWTAPNSGLYRIVASSSATTATKASTGECYYRAEDPGNNYRLAVKQNGAQVTNISYNAAPVILELQQRTDDTWTAVRRGVSYKVNNTACDASYTPGAAGSYLFSALVDGSLVASSILAVSKVPITVTPTWEGTDTIPDYNDIKLVVTDAQGRTLTSPSLEGIMKVSCGLYNSSGAIASNAATGSYTVTPDFVNDAAKKAEFLSRYSVTINTGTIYYFSRSIAVHFSAGENGEVYARYIDPMGTEFAFSDGSQISMDYRLKFVAEPAEGWFVDDWTVTLDGSPVAQSWYTSYTSRYGNTLEFTAAGMQALNTSGKKEISVSASFTNETHQITYSAGDNGSLRVTAGSAPLTSGASVAHNAAVTFTAAPAEGMMVEKWLVNGGEYKWEGADALYRENILTLKNIAEDYDVQVLFTAEETTRVTASAVDAKGVLYTAATLTVTDAEGNTLADSALGSVPRSDALTFTAAIDNSASAVVQEWQTSTDHIHWTTVTNSGGQNSITVYEHGEELYVRVVIAVAQTYELSWKVMEGTGEITDGNIPKLTAKSGNTSLTSGNSYAVNSPVTFTLDLDGSYYVTGWSNNVTPAEDNKSATLTLTDNTAVTVTVAKKPTVSWTNPTGGAISVKGTVNGTANTPVDNGGYVDLGTELTVTLKPSTGYEVGNLGTDITAAYTDGNGTTTDDKTYTISNVQTNQTIVPVWTEIPTVTVSHSVVDKNGTDASGLDGTLTMSVTRKGMSDYAVTNDKDGTETVYRDSVVTFTAEPDTGYKIGKWIVNGKEQSAAPTLTITGSAPANQTVQVQFDPVGEAVTYGFDSTGMTDKASLSAVYQANGTTLPSSFPSGNKPTANGVITFTVSDLADGYEVEGWYVNNVKVDGQTGLTYAYSVTANVGADVKVKIIRSSYPVTFSGKNGTVSAKANGTAITSGDRVVGDTSVTFTAAPADATGYIFAGWTVDGAASEEMTESLTLTITKDTVVEAIYTLNEVRYTVTYGVIGENGTLSARRLDADNTAAAGSNVAFTAKPADGYRVKGWYSNADGTAPIPGTTFEQNSYTLENLLANASVYVAFETIPTYDIIVNVTGLGTVTATVNGEAAEITNNKLTVSRHDNVVLTAAPDAYQYLTGWTLDSTDQGNGSMTLTLNDVTEAHTVAAKFAASQLVEFKTVVVNSEGGSLTAKAGYGKILSTIDASTGISIEKGKNVVLTADPADGYMVKEWKVNGVVQDNLSNTLTIENLSKATEVTVEFEPLMLHSIPGNGTGYTISNIKKMPSDYGEANQIRDRGAVTFTVTPDSSKYLTKLIVNGTDCLTSTGTSGPENKLTIRNNGDGSFTITVANVKNIALSVESVAFQTVKEPLSEVPNALQSQYKDVETLQTALRAEVKQIDSKVPDSQTALFDIVLKYTTDGGNNWIEADKDNFPAGGITVSIPYSELGGTDRSYDFTVIHMFTTNMNGHTIGDTERITPTKTETGISFTVTSLSPFAIGWSKTTTPPAGGGGGGAIAPAETVVIKDSVNGKVTADNKAAAKGDTVTLTVTPDKGYTLETLTVTDKNGGELKLTEKNGKYTFTMPASNVTVKATFMEDNSMLNFFVDVPADAYYYDAVLWAVKNSITSGVDETHFAPNATCTRAQAVTFLWRAAGSPEPESSEMIFTDVAEGSYYHDAVLWAVENGITKGTSDTTFSPDATCSRGQIVTFLWRSQESPDADGANPFTDVADDAYYSDAVLWAVENGITTGTTDTTFSPNDDCTRAQIVTFLWRAL
ncbi:MAG: S-layer homology domain-containing protein, partial [Bacillota bacterium]|nr:S-layer homology domain-containing protein [Bacillota bacterium]